MCEQIPCGFARLTHPAPRPSTQTAPEYLAVSRTVFNGVAQVSLRRLRRQRRRTPPRAFPPPLCLVAFIPNTANLTHHPLVSSFRYVPRGTQILAKEISVTEGFAEMERVIRRTIGLPPLNGEHICPLRLSMLLARKDGSC